jgi:tetratricopeptide (TPR) repeat protein
MNTKLVLPAVAALSFVMATSCSSKLDPLTSDNFTCNPSPLVEVGGQVDATISATYPEKYFSKKASLTVTPVLVYATGETKSAPITFQGEKVKGNDQTISYKYGGNATIKATFDYIDDMASSKLYLDFEAECGGKTYTLPRVYIADGVIATESVASARNATPANAKDNFVKDTFDKYIATLIYQYQSTNLRSSETGKSEMKDLEAAVKATKNEERREFTGIEMVSTASPEGAYSLNERLAAGREKSSASYLNRMLKQAKLTGEITPEQIAENWDGFKALVEASSIQDKQLVLNVLSRISDPDSREAEIRNLSAAYSEIADEILPQLRYSKVTATVKNIGHTDDEILSILASNPSDLTVEELLYAATLQKTDDEKIAVLNTVAKTYPNDYRAYNNIGEILYAQGKLSDAKNYFDKALSVNSSAAEPNMNLGLIALDNNDLTSAEAYFGKAGSANELGEAMGTLLTKQGKYAQAVSSFGDAKTNNAAVANICANNYSAAKSILEGVESKDATTYYLLAVVGARTNNSDMVSSNLKQAVSLDSTLASKAKNDCEFAKYASVVAAL